MVYHGKVHRYNMDELKIILSAEEIASGLFFIVGSASALLGVEDNLKELGIDKNRIHDERLTM